MFEVSEAKSFYHAIAPNYDERNSDNLILDLGGGTGQNIATHFFSDANIHWTYIDFCPAMVEQLEQHLRECALSRNLHTLVEDINRIHLRLQPEPYSLSAT